LKQGTISYYNIENDFSHWCRGPGQVDRVIIGSGYASSNCKTIFKPW
jgi:hypothetical protein